MRRRRPARRRRRRRRRGRSRRRRRKRRWWQRRRRRGLELLRADDNKTGFRGVKRDGRTAGRPFAARPKRDGRDKYLGNFATAEEAALAVARHLAAQGQEQEEEEEAAAVPAPGGG